MLAVGKVDCHETDDHIPGRKSRRGGRIARRTGRIQAAACQRVGCGSSGRPPAESEWRTPTSRPAPSRLLADTDLGRGPPRPVEDVFARRLGQRAGGNRREPARGDEQRRLQVGNRRFTGAGSSRPRPLPRPDCRIGASARSGRQPFMGRQHNRMCAFSSRPAKRAPHGGPVQRAR